MRLLSRCTCIGGVSSSSLTRVYTNSLGKPQPSCRTLLAYERTPTLLAKLIHNKNFSTLFFGPAYLFILYLFTDEGACWWQGVHVEVRGQLSSLVQPCGVWGIQLRSSGFVAGTLPTEPSRWLFT